MGYRSDVGVVIYPSPDFNSVDAEPMYDRLKLLMNTTFKDVWGQNDDCATWNDAKLTLTFEFSDVKWYDSFPDVRDFMAMLEDISDIGQDDYAIEFVRIGEDYDDIERQTWGNTDYKVDVRRELVFE